MNDTQLLFLAIIILLVWLLYFSENSINAEEFRTNLDNEDLHGYPFLNYQYNSERPYYPYEGNHPSPEYISGYKYIYDKRGNGRYNYVRTHYRTY